jgi:hypothetical protein
LEEEAHLKLIGFQFSALGFPIDAEEEEEIIMDS